MKYIRLFLILCTLTNTLAAQETQPCDLSYPSDSQLTFSCRYFENGSWLQAQYGDQWQDVLRFNRLDRRHADRGLCLRVPEPLAAVINFSPLPAEWPEAATADKFILVDISEQFLGAYSHGQLLFTLPIAGGTKEHETPTGSFTINAFHRRHRSSLYNIEKTNRPYPMHYGLRFFTDEKGIEYWIHGRDLPGYPASHGCIGLSDEEMQKRYYAYPAIPLLADARLLYDWVTEGVADNGNLTLLSAPPPLRIIGQTPIVSRR